MILHVCIFTLTFSGVLYSSFSSEADLVLQESRFKTKRVLWNCATGIMQGGKRIQEDVLYTESEDKYPYPLMVTVCDGNGGIGQERIKTELVPLLNMKLHYQLLLTNILKHNAGTEALSSNIKKAFLEVNDDLKKINRDSQDSWYSGGSTVLHLLSDAEKFWLAFCGDSLAIWKESGAFKDTVSHHLAERTDSYNFSRSFGNFRCSLFQMTSEPDVYEINQLNTDWLLLATDGLWTHTNKKTVYNFIESNQKKDPKMVVHELSVLALFHDISANYECNYMIPVLKLLLLHRYPFLSRTTDTDLQMLMEKYQELKGFLQIFQIDNRYIFDDLVAKEEESSNPLHNLFELMESSCAVDGQITIEQIKRDIAILFDRYMKGEHNSKIKLSPDDELHEIFDRYSTVKGYSKKQNSERTFNVLKYEILRKILEYTVQNVREKHTANDAIKLLRVYAFLPDLEKLIGAVNECFDVDTNKTLSTHNESLVNIIERYKICRHSLENRFAMLIEKLMNGSMNEAEITHYSQLLAKLHSDNMAIVYIQKARENSVKKETTQKLVTEPAKNSWFSSTMSFLGYNAWNANNDDETIQ